MFIRFFFFFFFFSGKKILVNLIMMESFCLSLKIITAAYFIVAWKSCRCVCFGRRKCKIIVFGHMVQKLISIRKLSYLTFIYLKTFYVYIFKKLNTRSPKTVIQNNKTLYCSNINFCHFFLNDLFVHIFKR